MNLKEPIIELKNVSVKSSSHIGISLISLKIKKNSFVIIAGPNGAGKTTLLCTICGLTRIVSGAIYIFEKDLSSNINFIRKEIGYVPQIINFNPHIPLNVKDVVSMGRYGRINFFKRFSIEDKKIIDETIDLVGIKDIINRPIGFLSGGELRKVLIARALVGECKILLLDEPLSNLDLNAQSSILWLIENIHKEKNLTTIMASHKIDLIPKISTDLILLKNGKLIFNGDIRDGFRDEILSGLYDCRIKVTEGKNKYNYNIEIN